jgi:hypothetical protein
LETLKSNDWNVLIIVGMRFTKLNYGQYLLSSSLNYTLTNLADHVETISHDLINRYLRKEKLTPKLLWENVAPLIAARADGYLIFDDTVLDKRYGEDIELTRVEGENTRLRHYLSHIKKLFVTLSFS